MMAPLNNSNDTSTLEQVLESLLAKKEELAPEVQEAKDIFSEDSALDMKIAHVKAAILAFNPDFVFEDEDQDNESDDE